MYCFLSISFQVKQETGCYWKRTMYNMNYFCVRFKNFFHSGNVFKYIFYICHSEINFAMEKFCLLWTSWQETRRGKWSENKKKKNEKTKHAFYLKKRLKISLTQNFLFVPKNFVSLSFSLINKSASETGNVSVGKDSLEKE